MCVLVCFASEMLGAHAIPGSILTLVKNEPRIIIGITHLITVCQWVYIQYILYLPDLATTTINFSDEISFLTRCSPVQREWASGRR